jgi:hypothetical protein
VIAFPGSHETHASWTAAVYWDGSASAVFTTPDTELWVHDLLPRAWSGWRAVVELALAAGGSGQSHLVVNVRAEHAAVKAHKRGRPRHPVRRWTELRAPTHDEIESVQRELLRGFGEEAWEPEPSPGSP